jgi:hypothetical protein
MTLTVDHFDGFKVAASARVNRPSLNVNVNDVVPSIRISKAVDISDEMRLTSLKSVERFKFYEKNSISSFLAISVP